MLYKWVLNSNKFNFDGEKLVCKTPTDFVNKPVSSTNFCIDDSECGSSESPTLTTPIPTTLPSTTPIPDISNYLEQECHDESESIAVLVKIKLPEQMLRITEINSVELGIHVDYFDRDVALIWFESEPPYMHPENSVICRVSKEPLGTIVPQTIFINNLRENTNYLFCLMDIESGTVSPFSCISYFMGAAELPAIESWLSDEEKTLFIGMVVLSIFLCILFGSFMGYVLLRLYPSWLGIAEQTQANTCNIIEHEHMQ